MNKTYHGSCHCGAVRFECQLDLSTGTSKCNCSICAKLRFWKAIVKADAFRLLQGARVLSDYQFGNHVIHHQFCSRCGIKPFGHGYHDSLGDFYAINIACLDDVTHPELCEAAITFENGRNDDWSSRPAETRFL
jgi:hypothetical protein